MTEFDPEATTREILNQYGPVNIPALMWAELSEDISKALTAAHAEGRIAGRSEAFEESAEVAQDHWFRNRQAAENASKAGDSRAHIMFTEGCAVAESIAVAIRSLSSRDREGEVVAWDESRCRVCGWTLATSTANGCTTNYDCSRRPMPTRMADGSGDTHEFLTKHHGIATPPIPQGEPPSEPRPICQRCGREFGTGDVRDAKLPFCGYLDCAPPSPPTPAAPMSVGMGAGLDGLVSEMEAAGATGEVRT